MSSPVVFILGVGANIGSAVAKKFFESGYKVAVASRNTSSAFEDYTHVSIDLNEPTSVPAAFDKVRSSLGDPSVVVYNAAAASMGESPFSLALDKLQSDLNINTLSPYVALGEAIKGFEKLPSNSPKIFIYTGNRLNIAPIPPLLSLGATKSASAHLFAFADQFYRPKGFRFFYADERTAEGAPAYNKINGPGHAEFYYSLATGSKAPWHATFVTGHGYQDFGELKP